MVPAEGDLRLNSAIIFSGGESDSSVCRKRCGSAFSRIFNARLEKLREEGSARSSAIAARFRSRIWERIVSLMSFDLFPEPAHPVSGRLVRCRCFHELDLPRTEDLEQSPRGKARRRHLR